MPPFNEHPGDLLILNEKLSSIQDRICRNLGIELETINDHSEIGDDERLVFYDYTYFTEELAEEFIERARKTGKAAACCLRKGAFTSRSITSTMSVSEEAGAVRYQLSYWPGGRGSDSLASVVIDPDGTPASIRFPDHMVRGSEYAIPLSTKRIVQIEHWCNLWSCNIGSVLGVAEELLRSPRAKLLWMALRALSTNPWKVSSRNVRVGEGCDIHPRAYLENAILGDGVEVGAGAVIRGAVIGDQAVIADRVSVLYSVIGDRCNIREGTSLQFTLMYPDSFSSCRFMNVSTLGRGCFVGDGAVLTDFRFDGATQKVLHEGRLVDTGSIFLGPCIGPGSYIGSGVIVGPARQVPGGTRIVVGDSRLLLGDRIQGDFRVIEPCESYRMGRDG